MLVLLGIVCYLGVAALFTLRYSHLYFEKFEGAVRNGYIITTAISSGLLWAVNLLRYGVQGLIESLLPVREEEDIKYLPAFIPEDPLPEGTVPVDEL